MTFDTHPEYLGLLRSVCEKPDDDAPRLILADWLEDHGESDHAGFIRECIHLDGQYPDAGPHWPTRYYHLYDEWREGIRRKLDPDAPGPVAHPNVSARWSRGFLGRIELSLSLFTEENARWLFERYPITQVRLTDREPFNTGTGGFLWRQRGTAQEDLRKAMIPRQIFDLLPDRQRNVIRWWYSSDSLESANAALSTACVSWGRSLVGLPPYVPDEVISV